MKNKIFHLAFARTGGAGKVGLEISNEMKSLGHDANLIYLQNEKRLSSIIRNFNVFLLSIIDNFIIKKNYKLPFFSILRAYPHSREIDRRLEKHSLIHLHWIPGLVNLNKLAKSKDSNYKVVITLHDMWFFTGGCHFSNGCTQYETGCKKCPMVHSFFRPLVSKQHAKKKNFFSVYDTSKITSPSNNLLGKAMNSKIFKSNSFHHIENPVSKEIQFHGSKVSAREVTNIDEKAFVVGFVALDINDPRKNFKEALTAFKNLVKIIPSVNAKFIVVGNGFNKSLSKLPHVRSVRGLKDPALLAPYFAAFDVLLLTSIEENSPLVAIEALANNCFVIASSSGGTKELIESSHNGHIYTNVNQLTDLLIETFETKKYENVKFQTNQKYSINLITQQYLKLYESFE